MFTCLLFITFWSTQLVSSDNANATDEDIQSDPGFITQFYVFDAPLSQPYQLNDCAVYLDRFIPNLRRPNCIRYSDVDEAISYVTQTHQMVPWKVDWTPEDMNIYGEANLKISRYLMDKFQLSAYEVRTVLPQIDTMKTTMRNVCPDIMMKTSCYDSKYRSIDGSCSNLLHPSWGSKGSAFRRLVPPVYEDGISSPRQYSRGEMLPNPRLVSTYIHLIPDKFDHALTTIFLTWGQFMDHDLTLLFTPRDQVTFEEPENCCKYRNDPSKKDPNCIEFTIHGADPYMGPHGKSCIDMHRAQCGQKEFCKLGHRSPFNILSSVIDGNTVYSDEAGSLSKLRLGVGGLLKMNPQFRHLNLKDLLPPDTEHPRLVCRQPHTGIYCFLAGEFRVNDQILLTALHTLMAREHNRIATALAQVNPHWDDEHLFQEARRINIAEIQHITFNEFLPLMVGKSIVKSPQFDLQLLKKGYYTRYDPNIDPTTTVEFSLALRIGHTLLPSKIERWNYKHQYIGAQRLSEIIRRPFDLYVPGHFDEYVLGMTHQLSNSVDEGVTKEVINHLFQEEKDHVGVDLVAFNIQRGRDFALPGFLAIRSFCGLPIGKTWYDVQRLGIFRNETFYKYQKIYRLPEDIDFWTGAISELPLPDAAAGPTIACVLAHTFTNLRKGDKFWYETGGYLSSFKPDQLQEIRKARLFRILCDNTDYILNIQAWPMIMADLESNPPISCRTNEIPGIDFSKWKEALPSGVETQSFYATFLNARNVEQYIQGDDEVTIQDETEDHSTNEVDNIIE